MHRIELGNDEFEGQNNAYLLEGDGLALVDTGIATPDTRSELLDGLASYGYGFNDIDAIVLTHWHTDHTGLAGEIQQASGATVYAHAADAALAGGDEAAFEAYASRQQRRFDAWGIPDAPQRELEAVLESTFSAHGPPAEITPVDDGDVVTAAGCELTVRHAPGHTAGSSLFVTRDGRAFVGDVVLPIYTPNIGGADLRVDQPLATYLDTLAGIVRNPPQLALTGHRSPIEDVASRAAAIIRHHRERTERVLSVLDTHGPADAWTVSAHLFGDLDAIHIMHGPGEAFAHLEHLSHAGVIERDGDAYTQPVVEPSLDKLVPAPSPSP